jgi:hypothetical protein
MRKRRGFVAMTAEIGPTHYNSAGEPVYALRFAPNKTPRFSDASHSTARCSHAFSIVSHNNLFRFRTGSFSSFLSEEFAAEVPLV